MTTELNIDLILNLSEKAEKILRSEYVDDTNFAYFGSSHDGHYYIGFDCWNYGDKDYQNYSSSALVKARLNEYDEWVDVVVDEHSCGGHFYEDIYRSIKNKYNHQILK